MAQRKVTKTTTRKRRVAGGVIIDGSSLDVSIPKAFIDIYRGQPRVVLKKLEWYGIHPIPIDLLSRELKGLAKTHTFIAVPNEMLK